MWVEPLFGEGQQWHGLRRFRVRGLVKVNCEGVIIATGQNLKRLMSARGWGGRWFPGGALGVRLPSPEFLYSHRTHLLGLLSDVCRGKHRIGFAHQHAARSSPHLSIASVLAVFQRVGTLLCVSLRRNALPPWNAKHNTFEYRVLLLPALTARDGYARRTARATHVTPQLLHETCASGAKGSDCAHAVVPMLQPCLWLVR